MSALTLNRGWLTLLVVLGLFGLGVALFIGLVVVGVRDRRQPEARSTSVIPDPAGRSTSVRAALALSLVLIVSCTGPAGPSSPKTSLSQPKLASGGVIEYPIPIPAQFNSWGLGGLVAGPDGNIWFVESIANLRVGSSREVFGRMTPSGTFTEFELPGQLSLLGMTAGPDGNIWTTAYGGTQGGPDWILRISRAGEVTKFQAGAIMADGSGTSPEGITAGPDGNIWFTEVRTGRIGRMTPAGALTEFQIPAPSSGGIAAGPDGNLWYLESGAIARITPAGAVTEYPLSHGPTDLRPGSIVAGSDGNIWFTETGNQLPQANVGRITPKGTVTRFALPPGSQPAGLARGPDGNVWFTNWSGNTVGRISPRGTIREFRLPRLRAGPSGMAAGPDGRVWFAETGVSKIASIGVTVPEVTFGSKVVSFGTKSALSTRTVAITNTGDAGLNFASAVILGPDQDAFTKTRDDCTGRTIAPNATCQMDVAFTPGSYPGVRAARFELTDNATASPQAVSLFAQVPTCTLPVFESSPSQPGTYQLPPAPNRVSHGAFLSLADGHLASDPKGSFTTDAQRSSSQAGPVLNGQLPASYDRAAARWVPAAVEAISPDGTRYAYVDYQEMPRLHMHVVEVATGHDRQLDLPAGFWAVLDFAPEGIYYSTKGYGPGPGLWLIDPDTGTRRQIFGDGIVNAVGAGAAWIGTVNAHDPNPPLVEGDAPLFDELLRRDLSTGETVSWFYRPGASVGIGSVSGGRVLVTTYEDQGAVSWLVSGPNQAERLTAPDSEDAFSFAGGMIADPQGFWLGGEGGIYLWTPRTGAVLVSEVSARPAGVCA